MLLKRMFDIVVSLAGLLILLPLLLYISILIYIKMSRPVFFKQVRTGRYGKPFSIYKFRTMINGHNGNSITINGENRITKFGKKLRKYKLDELPELWNVLIGDMSLVGPRPDVQEYTGRLKGSEIQILNLRPGLTCPASLKYVNEEEILKNVQDPYKYYDEFLWPDKVKMNLSYFHNRNFFGDILILFQTLLMLRK